MHWWRKYLHITALRLIYLSSAFWRNYMAIREMGNNFRHDALAFSPFCTHRSNEANIDDRRRVKLREAIENGDLATVRQIGETEPNFLLEEI